jgi:hypothetical protein
MKSCHVVFQQFLAFFIRIDNNKNQNFMHSLLLWQCNFNLLTGCYCTTTLKPVSAVQKVWLWLADKVTTTLLTTPFYHNNRPINNTNANNFLRNSLISSPWCPFSVPVRYIHSCCRANSVCNVVRCVLEKLTDVLISTPLCSPERNRATASFPRALRRRNPAFVMSFWNAKTVRSRLVQQGELCSCRN